MTCVEREKHLGILSDTARSVQARQRCAGRPPAGTADGGTQPADSDLTVQIDRGDGTPAETYTLSCPGTATGDLADPAAVCTHLQALPDPFAPLPADAMCTEQFGGPQTARVTGRWEGEPVDLSLSRTDGCQISQWDALGPLLPGPVG